MDSMIDRVRRTLRSIGYVLGVLFLLAGLSLSLSGFFSFVINPTTLYYEASLMLILDVSMLSLGFGLCSGWRNAETLEI